jgi:hypothetical protein
MIANREIVSNWTLPCPHREVTVFDPATTRSVSAGTS